MIDTDKYNEHTEGPWVVDDNEIYSYSNGDKGGLVVLGYHSTMTTTNLKLIADAPILLSEYKRLLKNINEYVDKVEAFHKMLKEEYEMKHKIPLCPENKDEPTKHNWVMDDWVGHRCVDCGFHLGKPLSPPKWKGDEE